MTLTRRILISSTSPAARNCWSVFAPISPIRFSAATSWAFARALSIPSVANVNTGSELAGGLWVTTKHGTSPSGPLSPHASIELSYDRRPMITAPVSVSTDRGGVGGPLPRRYPDHDQNDTQPAFSTSYGLMTTFTFRSSPTTDWKALATRVARSCSASLVRVGSSQRSTLILATVARKPSGS